MYPPWAASGQQLGVLLHFSHHLQESASDPRTQISFCLTGASHTISHIPFEFNIPQIFFILIPKPKIQRILSEWPHCGMGDSLSFDYVKLQITLQIPTSNFKKIVSPSSRISKHKIPQFLLVLMARKCWNERLFPYKFRLKFFNREIFGVCFSSVNSTKFVMYLKFLVKKKEKTPWFETVTKNQEIFEWLRGFTGTLWTWRVQTGEIIQNWVPRVSTGMAHGMTKQWIKLTVADCDICDLDVTRVDDVSHHRGERNPLFIAT